MVMCLGDKYGTECKRVVRTTRHTENWKLYQLCYKCFKDQRTEGYRLYKNQEALVNNG